ncbi:MAG TPA: hypothetical protein VFS63_02690 [Pseudolabrys sp.]|jgi:hypothetical protein|nr:hypothetical protein [Pseudolabrys sp.]
MTGIIRQFLRLYVLFSAFVLASVLACSTSVLAQESLLSGSPSLSDGGSARAPFDNGGSFAFPAQSPFFGSQRQIPLQQSIPMVPAGQVALALAARFGQDANPITGGLIWRIYAGKPDRSGAFRLVKMEKAPAPTIVLPAGSYIVHVDFGLATAVRPVTLRGQTVHETFDLPAGGLRLEGKVGNARIPASQITFDVYKGSQFDGGNRRPIAEHMMTGQVLIVPEGTYYIVSNYGDANSVVRSDIRVEAGKLTDITVTHRAAIITLKLVTAKGGEALANTSWSVLTPGGDVIKESIGAFPRVVLAEGEYRAIARNEGKIFEREFKVVTGVDGDVEVLAH